jgi:hypothetical protein
LQIVRHFAHTRRASTPSSPRRYFFNRTFACSPFPKL